MQVPRVWQLSTSCRRRPRRCRRVAGREMAVPAQSMIRAFVRHRGRVGDSAPRLDRDTVKIQGFIFSWKTHEAAAVELEREVGRFVDVTVINSEEQLASPHEHWIHLDDSAYFSAQWNRALSLLEGDVLFHMQADARCDDFERLFGRAAALFGRGDVGVYEPDVDYSAYRYERSRLRAISDDTFAVPIPDQTCWLVIADVLHELGPVDLSVNRYGWGISAAVAAVCSLRRKLCVRDYGVSVVHPPDRGYSSAVAGQERDAYLAGLAPSVAHEAARLYDRRSRVSLGRRRSLLRGRYSPRATRGSARG